MSTYYWTFGHRNEDYENARMHSDNVHPIRAGFQRAYLEPHFINCTGLLCGTLRFCYMNTTTM